jgi:hypothetical protein
MPTPMAATPASHFVARPFLLPNTSLIPGPIALYHRRPLYMASGHRIGAAVDRTSEINPALAVFGSHSVSSKVAFSYAITCGHPDSSRAQGPGGHRHADQIPPRRASQSASVLRSHDQEGFATPLSSEPFLIMENTAREAWRGPARGHQEAGPARLKLQGFAGRVGLARRRAGAGLVKRDGVGGVEVGQLEVVVGGPRRAGLDAGRAPHLAARGPPRESWGRTPRQFRAWLRYLNNR